MIRYLRNAVVLCLILVLCTIACADDETKARRLEAKAIIAIEEQRLQEAIVLYRNVIDRFPGTETASHARDRITFLSGLSHSVTSFPLRTARDLMVETARAVERYRWTRGRYPDKLDDLLPKLLGQSPIDPWGRTLQYERRHNGYSLSCFGADGLSGGESDASDLVVVNGEFRSDPTHEGPF